MQGPLAPRSPPLSAGFIDLLEERLRAKNSGVHGT